MQEIINLSIPSVIALLAVAGFYFNTMNGINNLRTELKNVKSRSDERDDFFKEEMTQLKKIINEKANSDTLLIIKKDISKDLDGLRNDIKEMNKILLQILQKK